MKSENTKYGISIITGLLVAALLIMLVVHCTSCTVERGGYGTPGVAKMCGYVPYINNSLKASYAKQNKACRKAERRGL